MKRSEIIKRMGEIVGQEDELPEGEAVSDELVAEFERLKAEWAALERTEPRVAP